MDETKYMKDRLDDQADWYSKKSAICKRHFYALRTAEIIAAALIPFAGIFKFDGVLYITSGLGVIIIIISGILSLKKYQENWLQYRTTCEALIREKFLYESGADPYDKPDKFQIFVKRIESTLSSEQISWFQNMITKNDKKS